MFHQRSRSCFFRQADSDAELDARIYQLGSFGKIMNVAKRPSIFLLFRNLASDTFKNRCKKDRSAVLFRGGRLCPGPSLDHGYRGRIFTPLRGLISSARRLYACPVPSDVGWLAAMTTSVYIIPDTVHPGVRLSQRPDVIFLLKFLETVTSWQDVFGRLRWLGEQVS